MRYRETLKNKLQRLDSLTAKITFYINRNMTTEILQTVEEIRIITSEIESYIEREPLSAEEIALKS